MGADIVPPREFPLSQRAILPFLALGEYVKLTILPFAGISPHHSFYWAGVRGLIPYIPVLSAAALAILCCFFAFARRHPASLVIATWIFTFLPVLHLVPLSIGDNIVHERFMYFPTAFLISLAPYGFRRGRLSPAVLRITAVVAAAFLAVSILILRSITPMWMSDAVLWQWVSNTDPQSREAKANLLWVYADSGDYEKVFELYRNLVKTEGGISGTVAINMGAVYYNMGDYNSAASMYELALRERSRLPSHYRSNLYASMAVVQALLGRDVDARGYIGLALKEDVVTSNAISNYLAFCKGRASQEWEVTDAQYQRALPAMKWVTKLLVDNQRDKYQADKFCPDAFGIPLPQYSN